jgi:peptidoglycan/xylan/chitin deacetylase (PgdA/CDA1 family)
VNIPILLYHSIARTVPPHFQRWSLHPDDFTAQMALLYKLGYTPIQVSRLAAVLVDRNQDLPERPVLITFDDGLADFHANALPVLRRYDIPATLYITTAYIGSTSRWLAREGAADYPMLTWEQIAECAACNVEIGAHSHTHAQLDTLPLLKAEDEILRSRALLEEHLDAKVFSFAYPHGFSSPAIRQCLPQAGYTSAVGVKHAMSSLSDDRFALARIIVSPEVDLVQFASLIEGKGLRVSSSEERLQTKAWRVVRRSYFQMKSHLTANQV